MIATIVIIFIILSLIFYWLILPLFKYMSKASYDIREAVLPRLLELVKTIITICSAAIIFTINLIDKIVIGKNYLIGSWFALIICIGIGVLILLIAYIERLAGSVFIKRLSDFRKKMKDMSKDKKDSIGLEIEKNFSYWILLNKILAVLTYLLVSSLFAAFLFMIIFGLNNF